MFCDPCESVSLTITETQISLVSIYTYFRFIKSPVITATIPTLTASFCLRTKQHQRRFLYACHFWVIVENKWARDNGRFSQSYERTHYREVYFQVINDKERISVLRWQFEFCSKSGICLAYVSSAYDVSVPMIDTVNSVRRPNDHAPTLDGSQSRFIIVGWVFVLFF